MDNQTFYQASSIHTPPETFSTVDLVAEVFTDSTLWLGAVTDDYDAASIAQLFSEETGANGQVWVRLSRGGKVIQDGPVTIGGAN